MTPGLAGFVIADGEPHWDDALDSVTAALAEVFAIAPERRPGACCRACRAGPGGAPG